MVQTAAVDVLLDNLREVVSCLRMAGRKATEILDSGVVLSGEAQELLDDLIDSLAFYHSEINEFMSPGLVEAQLEVAEILDQYNDVDDDDEDEE